MIEFLTPDCGAVGSRHFIIYSCLVLAQARKTHPDRTENLLTGRLRIKRNKNKQIIF